MLDAAGALWTNFVTFLLLSSSVSQSVHVSEPHQGGSRLATISMHQRQRRSKTRLRLGCLCGYEPSLCFTHLSALRSQRWRHCDLPGGGKKTYQYVQPVLARRLVVSKQGLGRNMDDGRRVVCLDFTGTSRQRDVMRRHGPMFAGKEKGINSPALDRLFGSLGGARRV